MPLVALSALLLVAGAAGRLVRPRIDVVARAAGDGSLFEARVDALGRLGGTDEVRAAVTDGEEPRG